jgi:hypothetical protein
MKYNRYVIHEEKVREILDTGYSGVRRPPLRWPLFVFVKNGFSPMLIQIGLKSNERGFTKQPIVCIIRESDELNLS